MTCIITYVSMLPRKYRRRHVYRSPGRCVRRYRARSPKRCKRRLARRCAPAPSHPPPTATPAPPTSQPTLPPPPTPPLQMTTVPLLAVATAPLHPLTPLPLAIAATAGVAPAPSAKRTPLGPPTKFSQLAAAPRPANRRAEPEREKTPVAR